MLKRCCLFVMMGLAVISGEYYGEEEGEKCDTEIPGVVGICKFEYMCDHTDRLINEEMKMPNLCSANITHRLVCCPEKNYQTGILGRQFMDSQNGKLVSGDIVCRYNGNFPLICCKRSLTRAVQVLPRFAQTCAATNPSTAEACKACNMYSQSRPKDSICPQETASKIAGGETADIEELPHMVVLGCRNKKKLREDDPDIMWVGGGTLISENFVLTAAHVLYSMDYGPIVYALLGSTNYKDVRNGTLANIVAVYRHKLYSASYHYHDIALVELDRRVPITNFTRPACLPVEGVVPQVLPNRMKVAGWGRVSQHGNPSPELKKGDLMVLPPSGCRRLQNSKELWNSTIMLCAKAETADSCRGDSGGPLMTPLQSNSGLCGYTVIGLVSFGNVCGKDEPGGYVRVMYPEYLEWITKIVWPQ
ncbi:venom protease-like [Battus philenor]|uniref:venom protease-like n=1 Tax=Battus philenor TaxID=42288 RepID=UPI0035CFF281